MKRIISILFTLVCVVSSLGCYNKDKSEQWYFKRQGNGETSIGYSKELLERTNSYWRDEDTEEKSIYLTFDAGYINENVIEILDVLKEEGVPGAFFILGHPLLKNTDVIVRMKNEGHLVCNHTKNHKDISTMTEDEIRKNLSDLEKMCEEKTGFPLDKYFRPPEGKFTEASLTVTKSMGYKNIFWSYAYADWDEGQQIKPQKALKKLKENLHDGEILLLHPTSKTNAVILRDFVQYAKDEGYRFKSLNEIK